MLGCRSVRLGKVGRWAWSCRGGRSRPGQYVATRRDSTARPSRAGSRLDGGAPIESWTRRSRQRNGPTPSRALFRFISRMLAWRRMLYHVASEASSGLCRSSQGIKNGGAFGSFDPKPAECLEQYGRTAACRHPGRRFARFASGARADCCSRDRSCTCRRRRAVAGGNDDRCPARAAGPGFGSSDSR